MRTLYIECNMGAAGDMLTAGLLELHPDAEGFLRRMNELNLPGVRVRSEKSVKCGITGTHISVTVNDMEEESVDIADRPQRCLERVAKELSCVHEHIADHIHEHGHDEHGHSHSHDHHHAGMHEIGHILSALDLPQRVKDDALAVYGLIAEAESRAHNKPVKEVHFHEVGALDAVADVVGVCLLIHELAPEKILVSPIHVGSGQVRCAHGILPVPAPATAYILEGVPIYGGGIRGELCTPTGAALLKYFADEFAAMPVMRVLQIGYGMGMKDFEQANCIRVMLGETEQKSESVVELCCNLDDMTPEAVGFAAELLMEQGALDVYTTAVQMKKNRPGVLLTCMCRQEQRETMLRLLFRHTSTLGVRESVCNRYTLQRRETVCQTEFGPVRVKEASGWGVQREKAEYDDLVRVARERGISFAEAAELVQR